MSWHGPNARSRDSAVQRAEVRHPLGPEGVQVEVADQVTHVGLLLHHEGRVAVLEEMTHPVMPPVEGPPAWRGEEGAHVARERPASRPDQQVGVIGYKHPGVDRPGPRLGERGQAGADFRAVGIVADDGRPLDPPHYHVLQGPVEDSGRSAEGIEARLAGHGRE